MESAVVDLELRLVIDAILDRYGLDFRNYSRPWLKKQVLQFLRREELATVSGLQEKLLHEPKSLERFLGLLGAGPTSLFRDPGHYAAFRREIVPRLRTYASYRIWVAGCGTGEEVYSLAILLEEEGVYDRGRIYGTDLNPHCLEQAKRGRLAAGVVQQAETDHAEAGGLEPLAAHFTREGDQALVRRSLHRNIVFFQHNLVSDSAFNEFNVIWCRNVLVNFDRALTSRVLGLFSDSLAPFGILALGENESIELMTGAASFEPLPRELPPAGAAERRARLYRRVA